MDDAHKKYKYILSYIKYHWLRKGCLRASLAENRTVGSNLRHLLKKSIKSLSSQFNLDFKFVNFGM